MIENHRAHRLVACETAPIMACLRANLIFCGDEDDPDFCFAVYGGDMAGPRPPGACPKPLPLLHAGPPGRRGPALPRQRRPRHPARPEPFPRLYTPNPFHSTRPP